MFSRIRRNDEGAALITVIGIGAAVAAIVVTAGVISSGSLSNSRQHVAFGQALDAAETGTDQLLARLQQANFNGQTYSQPAGLTLVTSPTMTDPEIDAAARAKILELADTQPSLVQSTPTGDYLAIAPEDRRVVYSMSWVPNRSQARSARLLKTEYLFSTYGPGNAILTGGDLRFSGSVSVIGSDSDPTAVAPVHSNGDVHISSSSLTTTGTITSSGSITGNTSSLQPGSGGTQPQQTVPAVDPEQIRRELLNKDDKYRAIWRDLCPNGTVQVPKWISANQVDAPCTGSLPPDVVADNATTTTTGWQGWTFSVVDGVARWDDGNQHEQFVYYAHHGDVRINDNLPVMWKATVIASADKSLDPVNGCSKRGGNILYSNQNMEPKVQGLMFVAGQDLVLGSGLTVGTESNPGLVAAVDQIDLDTSSATIYGAIIVEDECETSGSPAPRPVTLQGITLKFSRGLNTPIASIIRTVLWLEMPAQ